MKRLMVDACFLIAVFDKRDKYEAQADQIFSEYVEKTNNVLLVPWPIVYESISTRMVRTQSNMVIVERTWRKLQESKRIELVDDAEYREDVIEAAFQETTRERGSYRELSLADRVVRNMLADVNLKIDGFVTFNFGDFSDVCAEYNREIVRVIQQR